MHTRDQLLQYVYLLRLHKPVGYLLLLWPTLWALWLANHGAPSFQLLFIFCAGVILTRSGGCIINDIFDRQIDQQVQRTKYRPIANKKIRVRSAIIAAGVLAFLAFLLVVLFCNRFTIFLAIIGAILATLYPLLKRVTHLPQVGLGIAFAWGIPMAFAATQNHIPSSAWFLFATALIWPVIYDTFYAMVDRDDDIKIGVKSTAILFASYDQWLTGLLQMIFLLMLVIVGYLFQLKSIYYLCLSAVALLFFYQQFLIKDKNPERIFQAFLNNQWVGLVIFIGILLSIQIQK